jgi:uncharacterized protein (TIGR03000 family)
MSSTRTPLAGLFALAVAALIGSPPAGRAGPPSDRSFRYYYEPSYFGYDLMDTHPGYFGGARYQEYYKFGFRDPGFAFPYNPKRSPSHGVPPAGAWSAHPPTPVPVYLPPREGTVHVTVRVPADAEVWIEGVKTRQTGPVREFVSPPLTVGEEFLYEIRARWTGPEGPGEETRNLAVRAGDRLSVEFGAERSR